MATTYVLCGPISNFADDVRARCAECGDAIVHRPHVPRERVKVCIACGVKHLGPGATIGLTKETVRELALWRARTRGVQ